MNSKIAYIAIDVDDNAFHGSILLTGSGELKNFRCRPTVKGLQNQLEKLSLKHPSHQIRICYEASYVGFSLQRSLVSLGYHCEVIAPNSVPRTKGHQIKTDRVDAEKLVQFFANGQLTEVIVPDEEMEHDRDLLRSRQFVMEKLTDLRSHIQGLLKRNGLNYKAETGYKSHWTKPHIDWLERKSKELPGSLGKNLQFLIQQMKWLSHTLKEYDQQINEMAETEKYRQRVQALTCYRGIRNIFAMVIITEIGSIERFSHPRKLASFMGLDVREYSSGGVHHRFGITKHGNRHLRTALVEANQRSLKKRSITGELKTRRKDTPPELTPIADRCMDRVYKKGSRLIASGKNHNKVKVACAREMVGFIWESLNAVS